MSKAIGSVLGTNVKANTSAADQYVSFLKSQDTSAADAANAYMGGAARQLAQTLDARPDYIYAVDGSDEARLRQENAVFQSYTDRLLPLQERQTADLETRLANQGLAVGSEAYERAMSELRQNHNDMLNQAAYKSVSEGQNAFSQSLTDEIRAAEFGNNARQKPITEIYNLLNNSPSSYENQMNVYAAQQGIAAQQANAKQQSINNTWNTVSALAQAGAAYAAGSKQK